MLRVAFFFFLAGAVVGGGVWGKGTFCKKHSRAGAQGKELGSPAWTR